MAIVTVLLMILLDEITSQGLIIIVIIIFTALSTCLIVNIISLEDIDAGLSNWNFIKFIPINAFQIRNYGGTEVLRVTLRTIPDSFRYFNSASADFLEKDLGEHWNHLLNIN